MTSEHSCHGGRYGCPAARLFLCIFLIQALAYYGKLAIHPAPLSGLTDLWGRAAVGPVAGEVVVFAGVLFHLGWMVFACVTLRIDQRAWRTRQSLIAMG